MNARNCTGDLKLRGQPGMTHHFIQTTARATLTVAAVLRAPAVPALTL
jgi:hypothetical protein